LKDLKESKVSKAEFNQPNTYVVGQTATSASDGDYNKQKPTKFVIVSKVQSSSGLTGGSRGIKKPGFPGQAGE